MIDLTLQEIQQWIGANVEGEVKTAACPTDLSTDSREVHGGEVFLALRGEAFDGHHFVETAFAAGACAAIVEQARLKDLNYQGPKPLLVVEDTLVAYGVIAAKYRSRFSIPVIAIVGSSGKTTTKEMVATILATRYTLLKNIGNENNEIGIPKTLLRLRPEHEAVVLELGTRKPGDIAYLCAIAQPNIGVWLNVGSAHLEFFGSIREVAKAKGELLGCLEDESSLALINADDCVIVKEALRTKGRLLGFSLERECHYCGEGLILDQEGGGHFSLFNQTFHLQIPGRHNVYNALAAVAVGDLMGIPLVQISQALNALEAVAMRTEILRKNGLCVINDSYNANPEAMRAALELLADMQAGQGRKVAVLGDMLELGPGSAALHAQLGTWLYDYKIDWLFATGEMSRHLVTAAQKAGFPASRAQHFPDKAALARQLIKTVRADDIVLVKASRGIALEEIALQLIS